MSAGTAQELDSLRIMAPASPGGGWDSTSRFMQSVLQETGMVPSVEVFNVPGAGGTVGLAQLASTERGEGDLLMTMGLVMTAPVMTNNSAVTLDESTPIASITAEYEVVAVPANSPVLRGLTSLLLGIGVGLVGIDLQTGQARYTLGMPEMLDGIGVVIVAVGLFAVGRPFTWPRGSARALRTSSRSGAPCG